MPSPRTQIAKLPDLIAEARRITSVEKPYRVAVAVAQDPNVLGAVVEAHHEGVALASLYGDENKIRALAEKEGLSLEGLHLEHIENDLQAARAAVESAHRGESQILMKGFVKTADLLKLVLSREYSLRGGGILSHVSLMELPTYNKLLIITDGGMIIKPSLEEKIAIIHNAGKVMRALGVRQPRVALLSMVDFVYPEFETSAENATIGKMGDRGQFRGMIVDGPVTFDVAFSSDAARFQNIRTPVAGKTDILVVNSIEEGNILTKSLVIFARARFAGIVMGAKIPIALVSRTDTLYNKKASIALGVVVGHYRQHKESR